MIKKLSFFFFSFLLASLSAEYSSPEAPEPVLEKAKMARFKKIEKANAEYRQDLAKVLIKADKTEIFLLKFDGATKNDRRDADEDFDIHPYKMSTKILKKKTLTKAESSLIIKVLAEQVANEEYGGGALCHFPIHGIRAYIGKEMILESSFCWVCENFSFAYSDEASDWLDTNKDLKNIFNKLLPIPKAELDRFNKKYPTK